MSTFVAVTDAADRSRFEARVGGEFAGFCRYIRTADLVEPAFDGKGVGGALARAALDDARERNLPVIATCPFIAGWMRRHPEYQDVAYQNRSRVSD